MGDGTRVPVLALGVIKLNFESCDVILNECHYYPFFILNIISVGQLANKNYEFSIQKDIFNIIMNGVRMKIG